MVSINPAARAILFFTGFAAAVVAGCLILFASGAPLLALPLFALALLAAVGGFAGLRAQTVLFIRMLETLKYSGPASVRKGLPATQLDNELFALYHDLLAARQTDKNDIENKLVFFQELIEHFSMGFFVVDESDNITFANNAVKKILGVRKLQAIADLRNVFPDMVARLEGMKTRTKFFTRLYSEGSSSPVSIYKTALVFRDKQFVLVTVENIGEEAAVLEHVSYQRVLRLLIHEIMNAVTPILSIAQSLANPAGESEPLSGETMSASFKVIERQSRNLLDFTDTFRDFIRKKEITRSRFKIRELFEHIFLLFGDRIAERKIEVNLQCLNPDLTIEADQNLMEHVFHNLVKNAIEAMQAVEKPVLSVTIEKNDRDQTVIGIHDNGVGIDEEAMEKIFAPFFTTKENGMGLGLSFCRQAVLLHNGSLSVQSLPGKETEFRIVL